ncbi:exported protein [Polynucleobacter sp. SHI8]|uniref:Bug family tripartite tricarboxylate transporter substrate binding protein n=1 Tax=unclassified Polynucleobacter TaxID=2640945 RepID=UPI00248F5646|nr:MULTISPECIES: tripartite tricarboxylate transporter substrate binding protein [unclassified Polynucleobacter]BDW10349.1 exported protein [Polynucleobacter sp. SHI2]BDW12795.1 exported protein [Polynucleobacter sp. SHI8]
MLKKILFALFLCFDISLTFAADLPNGYPNRPIHIIIPLAAGNSIDNGVRIITQKITQNSGMQFVIESLPGAAGSIGADKVAKAVPDGYTLGVFNDSILTMVPNIQTKITWDPIKDFSPITMAGKIELGLIVAPSNPANSAADLIAFAKKNPGKLNYGSGGNGSPQHIAMALFNSQAGTSMTHVPYKGIMQAATGVAGGEVELALIAVSSLKGLSDAGKLKFIGVASQQRLAQFANTPTISESGLPGFEFTAWFAFMAPQGTPKPIVQLINSEVKKALSDKDVREKMLIQGLYPANNTPEELQQLIRSQLISYGTLIKKMGLQPE